MFRRGRVSVEFVVVLIALSGFALAEPTDQATTTFRIPEYGIEFSAPSEFFSARPLSRADSSVKSVESTKGGLVVTCVLQVPSSVDLAAALEAEFTRRRNLPLDGAIAYARLKKGEWFILSGTDGSSVYYTKAIALQKGIAILDATYSLKKKEMLDPVVTSIMRTFVPIAPGVQGLPAAGELVTAKEHR
jgi:hypothetical protein